MKNTLSELLNHKRTIYTIMVLPLFLLVLYQIIHHFIFPLRYISWPSTHLLIAPFIELVLIFFLVDCYNQSKQKGESHGWLYISIFSLLNLNAVYLLLDYYSPMASLDTSSIKLVTALAPTAKGTLIIFTLLSWAMSIQHPKILWEKFSFDDIYLTKSRLTTIVILLAFFALGLVLRLYNLSGYPPYFDEYYHTSQAVRLLDGEPLEYHRAFIPVTLPVYISYKFFGVSLWAGRAPMVLLNMLAIIPLYLLGRKFNQLIGFICVGLFVFSPYIVATSRNIRDYAFAPLLFYTTAVLLIELLDWENSNLIQYLQRHKFRILFAVLVFAFIVSENRSILQITISLYGIFGLLAIIKVLKQNTSRLQKITALILGSALIFFITPHTRLLKRYIDSGIFIYQQTDSYWGLLVNSDIHQWYTITALGYWILLIGLVMTLRALFLLYTKTNFIFLFCFLAFTSHIVYLTFFLISPRFSERTRYGILMEFWYLPLVAITIWGLFHLFTRLFNKKNQVFLIFLLIGLFSNPQSILSVITYQGGHYLEVTGDRHYILEPSYQILEAQLNEQDILITDLLDLYDDINGQKFKPDNIRKYREADILSVIEEYPHGWIALSVMALPEKHGLHFKDFTYDGKQVHYFGMEGEVNLWQWGE